MKEAIQVDLGGKYIEPTIVEDSVTGVFDIRKPAQPSEGESPPMEQQDSIQPMEVETVLVGYTVAVQAPHGLYQPTFDVVGYRKAMQEYETAQAKYEAELVKREPESEEPPLEAPQQVDGTSFWSSGLTAEEIAALHEANKPEPTPMEYLGKQVIKQELENLELRKQNEATGASIVATELRILEKVGGIENV